MTRKKHWSRAKRVTNVSFAIFICLCKKYDMDSLGNSMSFHVTDRRQFGPNGYRIPWLFHVIYLGFICFPYAQTWNSIWTSSNHGISMTFTKKMMGFSSDLVSFLTKLPQKTWKTPFLIFYRDGMIYFYIVNLLFRIEYDSLKSYIMYFDFTFIKP